MREETFHHPDPLTLTRVTDTWLLRAGWAAGTADAGRGQRERRGSCGSGEEAGTYLGNLCFSFLRLCLVGGTHTRHWAISSYWALVSIMLGQSLGGGGTSHRKTTLGRAAWVPGGTRGGHTGARRGVPHFLAGPPALHLPENSLSSSHGGGGGL